MKTMNRCAKAQCAAAGGKKIDGLDHANVDPAGGEHFGLVLIACAELAAAVARVSERAKVYRKHRKSNRFLQRQKQFCVCGICVIFVVLSYTVKWE